MRLICHLLLHVMLMVGPAEMCEGQDWLAANSLYTLISSIPNGAAHGCVAYSQALSLQSTNDRLLR